MDIDFDSCTREEFLELIKGQSSIRGVARTLNCSKVKARNLIQHFEVNFENPIKTKPSVDILKELYIDKSLSARQVAKELNLSRNMTLQLLRDYNLINEKPKEKREKRVSTKAINKLDLENVYKEDQNIEHNTEYKEFIASLPDRENVSVNFYPSAFYQVNIIGKGFHQDVALALEEKNQFEYKIFQFEWDDSRKREKIKNQIKNLFGLNSNRVFARKCEVKLVPSVLAHNFLTDNHLQGPDKSPIRLGLYYENELVALMTFCQPRFNKEFEYELGRFCCKADYNVLGGASKLFKYFLKNYNPSNIISYSDMAKTRGNMYASLGFKLHRIAKPNYVWYNGYQYLTRYQCQKHKLLKRFPEFKNMSETEIMETLGYYKVEDAGNKVWTYYNN